MPPKKTKSVQKSALSGNKNVRAKRSTAAAGGSGETIWDASVEGITPNFNKLRCPQIINQALPAIILAINIDLRSKRRIL
ncbi:hypothetical protein CF319_g3119 [Tilletia indica]|nr:hypothetical protein CF319_g3119 [Tilletia indica]